MKSKWTSFIVFITLALSVSAYAVDGDTLFFTAPTDNGSYALWVSNGTDSGTVKLKEDNAFRYGHHNMAILNSSLLFAFHQDKELWKTNGTIAGTSEILPFSKELSLIPSFSPSGLLYFFEGDPDKLHDTRVAPAKLWKTDGTAQGTQSDFFGKVPELKLMSPWESVKIGNSIFFTEETDHTPGHTQLWKTQGDATTTIKILESERISLDTAIHDLTVVRNRLFFNVEDKDFGMELWVSDGTVSGTKMVKDIAPGKIWATPRNFTRMKQNLFFTASTDEMGEEELWFTNGTESGTYMVKEIRPGKKGSEPEFLTAIGNLLYFTADDGIHGRELWRTDGTTAGTFMLKDILPGVDNDDIVNLTKVGNRCFFWVFDGVKGWELWKSNGTSKGTVMVKDIDPNNVRGQAFTQRDSDSEILMGSYRNTYYFWEDDGTHGIELWKSNGTSKGTVLVKDIFEGKDGNFPKFSVMMNETLYFVTNHHKFGTALWKSNGTEKSTVKLRHLSRKPGLATWQPQLLFMESD